MDTMADSVEKCFDILKRFVNYSGRAQFLKPNLVSITVSVAVVISIILGAAFGDPARFGDAVSVGSGFYAGVYMQYFWWRNGYLMSNCCCSLVSIARSLERNATSDIQRQIKSTSYLCSTWLTQFARYIMVAAMIVVVGTLILMKPITEFWPAPNSTLHLIAVLIGQSVGIIWSVAPVTLFVPFLFAINMIQASLFRATNRVIEDAKNLQTLQQAIKVHQNLLYISRTLSNSYSRLVVHTMAVAMLPPLFIFRDISVGNTPIVGYVGFPLMVFQFIPWCFSGQELETATENVTFSAYNRNWMDEDAPTRRAVLIVMARGAKPCKLSVYGLGALNRTTGMAVLKTWFSYLQLLIKA